MYQKHDSEYFQSIVSYIMYFNKKILIPIYYLFIAYHIEYHNLFYNAYKCNNLYKILNKLPKFYDLIFIIKKNITS